ncbi:MAG: tyrosine protein kinase [Tannerella sp.]|jgi:uncharacterized protein involved in exopolysaccharide biosynthesis|nr:tyrosine protein kinase [Tannerella sp.]
MEENKDTETLGLKTIVVRYLRQWKIFLIAFLFSLIPAAIYLSLYPKTFEFMARIQIQDDKDVGMAGLGLGEAAGLMKSFGIGGGGSGGVSIEDEISILTSNQMLSRMILDLGLNVEYTRPYSYYKMYHEAPLKLTPDSVAPGGPEDEYRFTVAVGNGKVKVGAKSTFGKQKETFTFTSLPARIQLGDAAFTLDFDHGASISHDFKLKINCMPASWQAEVFAEEFLIEDLSKTSNVIELTCTDHVKDRGIAMLNTLIQKYNENAESLKRSEDQKVMTFVDDRIDNIVSELQEVELNIEKYKTLHGMTLLESDVLFYTEQMKELQIKIVELEAQSYVIRLMEDYVKNPANKYEVIPSLLSAVEGEKAGAITIYNEALLERDRLLQNSNENNPAYKSMNAQVDKLREGVYLTIGNAEKSCQMTLNDLKAKEKTLLDKMKSVPMMEREYVSYRRQQEILQGVYLILLQKREETVLSLGHQTDRARVTDPAFVMKKPIGPRKLYAAIGMILLTLVLPVGYLFAKDITVAILEEYKRTK